MKRLIAVAALVLASTAFAGTVEVDTRGLSATQKAELVKQAEAMKAEAKTPLESVEKIDQWVNVGEKVGKMMGGAAKEVGIQVNEFVKTPVGQMTAFLIIWNYMGSMAVHVFGGLLIFITSFGLLTWFSRRLRTIEIVYDKEAGRNWLGQYNVKSKNISAIGSDEFGFLLFGYAAALAVSLITIFTW